MANEEHLAILKQGVEIWNKWREECREIRPDLGSADLRGIDLLNVDLNRAYLSYADLSYADLNFADLNHANLYNAILGSARLNRANLFRANLNGAGLRGANFLRADLSEADLRHAYLNGANLSEANLSYADLRGADLSYAHLNSADLNGANLSGADLAAADLNGANLSGADLAAANLNGANLNGAYLDAASFHNAMIGWTVFSNVDLSVVKGLDSVTHNGPSTIGIDAIYQSKGNIPSKFLLDSGMPQEVIDYLLPLAGKAINFYSCFISHSSQDKPFVERLYADLQAKGVRCWYAPEDLKIGEPFLLGIEQGIRLHDKLLLVLSEHSVASGWVQHEVLSAMAKEQGKAPWVLFPMRLDDSVLNTDVPWATMIKQSRHIGDFTQWKDHDAYQKAFDRLLRDLKAQI